MQCELPQINANQEEIYTLLKKAKVIAIIGISTNTDKDSYQVGAYLKKQGYKIIPVNPKYSEVLGEKSYPSLEKIEQKIDIIDIFRRPDAVPSIAESVLKLKTPPQAVWLQLGIVHNEAAKMLQEAGIMVIQSQCIKVVHQQLFSKRSE